VADGAPSRLGLALLVVAAAAWLSCFAILLRLGTWTPFAVVGTTLAGLTLGKDPAARALLRPSAAKLGLGVGAGLLMVAFTHAAFEFGTALVPASRGATEELFALLNVGGFSPGVLGALITVVATAEEIVFRGSLLGEPGRRGDERLLLPSRGELKRIAALACVYAFAMATLGSLLLLALAFACGLVWGLLRVVTRSLVVPILTHVVWDLGALVVWPLVGP
jgi:uncharacterized protein